MSLTPPTATEIKAFRRAAELSQAALAEKLGASTRAVEDWEGGRRLPPAMLRWALAALQADLTPWSFGGMPPEGRIMRAATRKVRPRWDL